MEGIELQVVEMGGVVPGEARQASAQGSGELRPIAVLEVVNCGLQHAFIGSQGAGADKGRAAAQAVEAAVFELHRVAADRTGRVRDGSDLLETRPA